MKLQEKYLAVIKELEQKHIVFHLGDEIMLERHGKVEGGKLVIGKQQYTYVIDTCCEVLLPRTRELLTEFVQAGGQMTTAAALPANDIIDHKDITYTRRFFGGFTVHYFVNTSPDEKQASFRVTGKEIDIYSGETSPFTGYHTFEPWGSLMVVEEPGMDVGVGDTVCGSVQTTETIIQPAGIFAFADKVTNCLTLDRCDYYFDGELQEKNGYVLNICERANKLERQVQIRQEYHVMMHHVPEELYLVCETPEKFKITVNGNEIGGKVEGYFRDKSFKKIDIAAYVQAGMNTISFECDFRQSDEFYENLRKSYIFESEKNKLAYDMEIEAVYLIGDFCVRTPGQWIQLERHAVRYHGVFELETPKKEICLKNMEQQGYPFFCGEMVLEGELEITGENPVLQIERRCFNAVKVEIGSIEKWMLTSDKLLLKEFGVQGKTKVKLTLINNLRNLLGPHHLKEGECLCVGPGSFFKEPCVWNRNPEETWDEDYCFVEMGI